MSKKEMFEQRYETGVTPWELDRPDTHLVHMIKAERIAPAKALDIGCGTGSNVMWLARQGFDVTGVDFSEKAILKAKEKSDSTREQSRFLVMDFLGEDAISRDFAFAFDRGCFHSFDEKNDRKQFACNVGRHLKKNGIWFSIIGNSDGEPMDDGPPTRSALEVVSAVDPFFEILHLKADRFDSTREKPARCWLCLMRKRERKQ